MEGGILLKCLRQCFLVLLLTIGIQCANPAKAQGAISIPAEDLTLTPTYPILKISGFSNFDFSSTDEKNSGFKQGQLILHFSSALSAKTSFFAEVSLTTRATGGSKIGLERGFIRFDRSDYFKASFGRYHTPVNWWNTAFHHGLWLQTSIGRPEMTKFGGQYIPVHFVGGLVEGVFPARGLNLHYNVGLGNGRDSNVSGAGGAGDNNNTRAWLINLFSTPDRFFGLQVGASLYLDKITLPASDGRAFRERIVAGHFAWQREDPELIAEIAHVHHHQAGGGPTYRNLAYYVQVGYRLPWFGALWKPYYRFEYTDIAENEPVFSKRSEFNRTSSIVGLRYDIFYLAAIKTEYRNQRRPNQPKVDGGFVQLSFTF